MTDYLKDEEKMKYRDLVRITIIFNFEQHGKFRDVKYFIQLGIEMILERDIDKMLSKINRQCMSRLIRLEVLTGYASSYDLRHILLKIECLYEEMNVFRHLISTCSHSLVLLIYA